MRDCEDANDGGGGGGCLVVPLSDDAGGEGEGEGEVEEDVDGWPEEPKVVVPLIDWAIAFLGTGIIELLPVNEE